MPLATAFRWLGHMQPAVANLQLGIGRDDIDVVGDDPHSVLDLSDGHLRASTQDTRHLAFTGRVEMKHDDESATAVGRHGIEKSPKASMPPADAPMPTIVVAEVEGLVRSLRSGAPASALAVR